MATEYISREDAVLSIAAFLRFSQPMARKILESIPAADVRPVVLCRDCVYSNKKQWYADRLICYLWNEHDGNAVFEDGFCNYGLKREVANGT